MRSLTMRRESLLKKKKKSEVTDTGNEKAEFYNGGEIKFLHHREKYLRQQKREKENFVF